MIDKFRVIRETKKKAQEQNKKKDRIKDNKNIIDNITLELNSNNLLRHGRAGKEFVVAYSGLDGNSGEKMVLSLKDISQRNLNPEYVQTNLKQQAGFSAEVLDTAKRNAEEQIRNTGIRHMRVDDVPGRERNETAFDVTAFDEWGNEILGSAAQMKFINNSAEEQVKTLISDKFQNKYPHGSFMISLDRFDEAKNILKNKEFSLQHIDSALQNNEDVYKLNDKLSYIKVVNQNLKRSTVSTNEALEARLNQHFITNKNIISLGHEAGKQYAKSAAIVTGMIPFSVNRRKVVKKEIKPKEAAKKVALDTAKSAGVGYAIGQVNTIATAYMLNSSHELIREMGKANAPAKVLLFFISIKDIVKDRMNGKISDEECYVKIAEAGLSTVVTAKVGKYGRKTGKIIGGEIGGSLAEARGEQIGSAVGCVAAGLVLNSLLASIEDELQQADKAI